MTEVLRAERTKLCTLTSVRWLLLTTCVALVAVGAAVAAMLDGSRCQPAAGCSADPVKSSLSGVWVAQVAVAVLGVLAMSSEYDTPQIRLTLAAMPRRLPVMVAKATVVAGLVVAAGAIGTFLALVAGRSVLATNGFGAAAGSPRWSLTGGLTVRAALGTVGYLVLVAMLALGVAAVVRDAAVAIVSVLGLLFLFPLLGLVLTDATWQHRLHRYSPMDAGLAVQATRGLDHLVIGPWAGLGILAAYSAATLLAGTSTFLIRDS